MLNESLASAELLPKRQRAKDLGLVLTTRQGHAREITAGLLEQYSAEYNDHPHDNKPFYLIITAGGDGTSREVMGELFKAPEHISKDFAILRLPMGTGNDGADAWDLDGALNLLIKPSELRRQRAVQLRTARGGEIHRAFNILSLGLDAFVTHMTNKMKNVLPGDFYKLWIDLAALFYDRMFKVGPWDVQSRDEEGNETLAFRQKLLLLAVGESGRRSYGSRKWILPDERNICAISHMSLLRRIALKGSLAYGSHIDQKESLLWNAHEVEVNSRYPLLAQMDGETIKLEPDDFPVTIYLSEPVIQILGPKTAGI